VSPPDDKQHSCDWQDYAKHLEERLREQAEQAAKQAEQAEKQAQQIAALQKMVFGKKSEKLPSPEREIRRQKREEDHEKQQAEALRKRRENAIAKTHLETKETRVPVPADQRSCPKCKSDELRPVGRGKTSTILRFIPGRFVREVFQLETLKCKCGEHIITAPPPEKATEGSRYDETFVAHLMVSKCGDSIPIYRLEKQYKRAGVNVSRATMNELLHRHAELLAPLSERLLQRIGESEIVLADETTIKLQSGGRKAWMWVFLAENLIGYRFSNDRSGKTPKEVLGATKGTLLVDAYTGYNAVTGAEGRERAGCLAHARRKLFEARATDESVSEALEFIQAVYRVEHDAKEAGISQSAEHLKLRRQRAGPAMAQLLAWLEARKQKYGPKNQLTRAINYSVKNWDKLTRFLDDPKIPVDNNRSESALRVIALGRKNFLFAGNEIAGKNLAGIYSLISTCEACGVNPMEYLPDVMLRISAHPASDIDALLPDRWQPKS